MGLSPDQNGDEHEAIKSLIHYFFWDVKTYIYQDLPRKTQNLCFFCDNTDLDFRMQPDFHPHEGSWIFQDIMGFSIASGYRKHMENPWNFYGGLKKAGKIHAVSMGHGFHSYVK